MQTPREEDINAAAISEEAKDDDAQDKPAEVIKWEEKSAEARAKKPEDDGAAAETKEAEDVVKNLSLLDKSSEAKEKSTEELMDMLEMQMEKIRAVEEVPETKFGHFPVYQECL